MSDLIAVLSGFDDVRPESKSAHDAALALMKSADAAIVLAVKNISRPNRTTKDVAQAQYYLLEANKKSVQAIGAAKIAESKSAETTSVVQTVVSEATRNAEIEQIKGAVNYHESIIKSAPKDDKTRIESEKIISVLDGKLAKLDADPAPSDEGSALRMERANIDPPGTDSLVKDGNSIFSVKKWVDDKVKEAASSIGPNFEAAKSVASSVVGNMGASAIASIVGLSSDIESLSILADNAKKIGSNPIEYIVQRAVSDVAREIVKTAGGVQVKSVDPSDIEKLRQIIQIFVSGKLLIEDNSEFDSIIFGALKLVRGVKSSVPTTELRMWASKLGHAKSERKDPVESRFSDPLFNRKLLEAASEVLDHFVNNRLSTNKTSWGYLSYFVKKIREFDLGMYDGSYKKIAEQHSSVRQESSTEQSVVQSSISPVSVARDIKETIRLTVSSLKIPIISLGKIKPQKSNLVWWAVGGIAALAVVGGIITSVRK